MDRVVQGLCGSVIDVGDAGGVSVAEGRQRAGDLFADNSEHHHVRARYEHGDNDDGCGSRQADHDAHVRPPPGKQHVRGAPGKPDDERQVSGDGEAGALAVVALRPEHERRRGAQQGQQQRVVRQAAQEQATVDEHAAQVGRGHDSVYGDELEQQGQLHAHGERAQGRLQVAVHVAHEAGVAVARGDHHAPRQHGGERDRAAGARADQLGVTHDVRVTGPVHGERHRAGVHEQRAGDQHERERRVAFHHVLLAHAHQYERGYARGAYRAHRGHGQRAGYPHVLLPRHPRRRGGRPVVLALVRRRRQARRAPRVRRLHAPVQPRRVAVRPQPARAVRVLHVRAHHPAAAAVLGHVHQRHVILAAV